MENFKDPTRTPETYNRLRTLSRNCGGLVIFIGVLVMAGWFFNITFLKSVRGDTVPMNPLVAITLIVSGAVLWLKQEIHAEKYNKIADRLCYFIILVGILKMVSFTFNLEIPFDTILFHDQLWLAKFHTFRTIAPNTAFNFTLTGLSLLLINYETEKGRRPSQFMGIGITLLGLLSLYGYLYGVPTLYEVKKFVPMSINTAFCFLLLGFGILFSRPDKGSMAVVIGESSGQIIFMRFIAFLLPLVYGYLKIQGEKAGYFSREFGTALFALLTYLVSMFFLARQSVLAHKIRETKREALAAIKENERRLQSILDHSAANISLKTLLGKYTLVNKNFESNFNKELNSIVGKTDYDLFPREMARELNLYDHQIIRTGRSKSFEEKYPQEDGIHTYLTVKFPLFNHDSKIYAIGAISTDITKRKKLEEELRESEERYSLALKGTNDGLWDWNIKTNYLFLSERWKKMLGYEDHEIENTFQAWEDQLHPNDRKKTLKVIDEYFGKKIPVYEVEFRMLHKDGSYRWMLDRGMALWGEDGKPYRMIGYQTDLTERKRLEEELRKSHQRLFSILDNLGEGVAVADSDSNLIIFNRRAEEIMGSHAAAIPWLEWNDKIEFLKDDLESKFTLQEMPLYQAIKGEASNNVEMMIRNESIPEGKWMAVTGRPVKNEKQEVIAGVIVFRDITLRKQLENLFAENEKRLKAILVSIGEGIVIIDEEEKVIMVNRKAGELLGEIPDELPLEAWAETFGIYTNHEETLLQPEQFPLLLALKGTEIKNLEVFIKNEQLPEGKNIYLSSRALKDNLGNLTGAILDFKDITQQRKLEEYLKEIENQFRELLMSQRPIH